MVRRPSPRPGRRSLALAAGVLLWAFTLVIPMLWIQSRGASSFPTMTQTAWMLVPLTVLFVGVFRRSAWTLLTVFPMSLLAVIITHPETASSTAHGWASVVAILASGGLHVRAASRVAETTGADVPWRAPIRTPLQAAQTLVLIAIPLGALQAAVLAPQWLLNSEEASHEALPTHQALLLVFAAIVWVVTLRLHGGGAPRNAARFRARAFRPLVAFAISALLVIRVLLAPENA